MSKGITLTGAGAVNLKFLSFLLHARVGTSNSKPHEKHKVASVPLIPKFAPEVPQTLANFGIGTLVSQRAQAWHPPDHGFSWNTRAATLANKRKAVRHQISTMITRMS